MNRIGRFQEATSLSGGVQHAVIGRLRRQIRYTMKRRVNPNSGPLSPIKIFLSCPTNNFRNCEVLTIRVFPVQQRNRDEDLVRYPQILLYKWNNKQLKYKCTMYNTRSQGLSNDELGQPGISRSIVDSHD